jgi:hypothetical protein
VSVEPGALLERDPVWWPEPPERERWSRADPVPPFVSAERRWWRAREAAARGDWEAVSALAEEGLGEPFSERELVRLAFLHCASGSLGEAEHVIALAVQTVSDESLPRRFAAWCGREGLAEAAARFG